ncbi:nucleoside-diphosphate-sugar epimerase [Haloactinopolyspora alba]|uniref:Nucleoside-diphosphate-sugar epimerase n=1 Tax=Haloactinopolyspora alba TaxID=648780 RepID=A0A2P8DLZ0_9ACTN|nr:NAD-dependent epimerase/dehydratase family protein [Haloactinopolyspora alba]PSK98232.1 nucleoside-diphosphate-sugar epimerase [Haloactinopolyspora alba]
MNTPIDTPEPTSGLHVVLGAGPAGTAIVADLAARGLPVRHVSRGEITDAPAGVETVRADVSTPAGAIAATADAGVIHHAVNVAYHHQVDALPGITDAVVTAAATHDARLVVLDTLYPYGSADGEHITEQTPWAATSRKGMLRAELDRRYLEAHRTGRARVVIGRSADFFGPGVVNSTLGGAFFPAALTGEPALALGDTTLPHSYSYVPDVARALVHLGVSGTGDGRVWHLPTPPAVSTDEVHRIAGELLGGPLKVTVLDEPVAFGPFDEVLMAEYAEMFYQHRIPQNMVSTAFETAFDIRPTPLRTALAATIEWYRHAFQL